MWLKAGNINCNHGFSTRHGGISPSPFSSLNLGGSEDKPGNIARNRGIALDLLKLPHEGLCLLRQVHSATVCSAQPGFQEGDALVTNDKTHVLAISVADCYPILFYDEVAGVIGAAHAGWRGTLGGIAGNTVQAMKALGANLSDIKVAIGQGISPEKFEVGKEVSKQFIEMGFPQDCMYNNRIDLIKCNLYVLKQNNILDQNIQALNRCTFEEDFFSYRRDKGVTGRMWGLITMR
ncbi:MAG: peptidoglycan editing factor PgeF [Bacteroidota bacterium]